ncbi:PspC domain-containing protein [Kineobactrum salinum]|uniref:PspC domain-containing protein n=1 Tax=Kineobactrum salinum TaxID=2708301 RepID=A0A6C0U0F2_9GAMM|nr:PspC domain-containing protein [Kineobactrum salinum]QIB64457.1 PspC domain-containing protein [Kineobactrum salinum]
MSRTRYHDRHYRRDGNRSFWHQFRGFRQRRAAGWGMNLYRNTPDGKIAGVSAGLADHFDVAHWVVRLLWVAAFLFTGTLALWAYVGAWILLSPRPRRYSDLDGELPPDDPEPGPEVEMEYDERHHHYRPRKVFRYSEPGSVRLRRARERLDAALQRVETMESYVTSRQYELNKEISRL